MKKFHSAGAFYISRLGKGRNCAFALPAQEQIPIAQLQW